MSTIVDYSQIKNNDELFYTEAKFLKEYILKELISRYKNNSLDFINPEKQRNYLEYTKKKILEMLGKSKKYIKINSVKNKKSSFRERIDEKIEIQKRQFFQKYLSIQDTRDLIEADLRIYKAASCVYHLEENLNPYKIDMNMNIFKPEYSNYKEYIDRVLKPKIKEMTQNKDELNINDPIK